MLKSNQVDILFSVLWYIQKTPKQTVVVILFKEDKFDEI